MRALWALPLLAGCAISPAQMQYESISRLCYLSVAGGPQTSANARGELMRRQYQCTAQDVQVELARQQAADAALLNAATIMQSSRPQPQVTCQTTPLGSGYSTTTCR